MKGRYKLEVVVFLILFFLSCVAREDYWVSWALLTIFWGVLTLFGKKYLDLLFMTENTFLFEPNYSHWEKLNNPKY